MMQPTRTYLQAPGHLGSPRTVHVYPAFPLVLALCFFRMLISWRPAPMPDVPARSVRVI